MKKLAIAGASVVLAALPVAGVFATTSHSAISVTDNLSFTLAAGCTMTREAGFTETGDSITGYILNNDVALGITAPGTAKEASGNEITITCTGESTLNSTNKTWLLKAVSGTNNAADTPVATLVGEGNSSNKILSGTAGGLDGDTSEWAFKIAAGDATGNASNFAITSGYSDYIAVPATAATIATMTYGSGANIYEFTPTYRASVSKDQAADTYKGSVTYTIVANPQS